MQRGSRAFTHAFFRSLIANTSPKPVAHLSRSVHAARSAVILEHVCRFSSLPNMSYTIEERGAPNTLDYRVFFKSPNGNVISPFHDIPLYANETEKVFNMVVEIPRWTNAKMEISKDEKMNPIKQDVKKGKLRYVKNVFPHRGYMWNYGAFPQTWEDPNIKHPEIGTFGDQDPLDVCEIGQKIHKRGAVIRVKVLGIMCLIDEGETDWKIIAIDVEDPLAPELNDIQDVEKKMPGYLRATYEWFKFYKVPDDKPENTFAFEGNAKDKEYALNVISETNEQWKNLVGQKNDSKIACENTTVGGSPYIIPLSDAQEIVSATKSLAAAEPLVCDEKSYFVIH